METLKTHFANVIDKSSKEINVRLLYDKWLCKESTERRQVSKVMPLSALLREHPDWGYESAYTTKNDGSEINVWAIATQNDRYDYPETLSWEEIKEKVSNMRESDDDICECYHSDSECGYYVESDFDAYERTYHHPKSPISNRIDVDKEVDRFLPKHKLAHFLESSLDPNSAVVLNKLCLVWDNEDDPSKVRSRLCEETCDEYALFAGEDKLGLTWVENQIVLINIREIMNSAIEIGPDDCRSVPDIFKEGLLQTIFHECRHLLYECNELVELGGFYPADGDLEENIEDYGNTKAKEWLPAFGSCINDKELTSLINVETAWLIEQDEIDF